jgi:hypothetical protein
MKYMTELMIKTSLAGKCLVGNYRQDTKDAEVEKKHPQIAQIPLIKKIEN